LRMTVNRGYGSRGPISVIEKFFRDHSSIDLIVTIGIDRVDKSLFRYGRGKPVLRLRSFENPRFKHPETQYINEILCELTSSVPSPSNDTINEIHHLHSKERQMGLSSKRGWKMTSRKVRLSARAIQELLAGRLTQENFFKLHRMIDMEGIRAIGNPFEIAFAEGRLIESVRWRRT
jgi:hypothetical protein